MRVRRPLLFVVGPLLVSACALVADLGDRTLGEVDASADDGGGAAIDDGATAEDASVDQATVDAVAPPPSYCEGIVLYASFDVTLAPEHGGASTLSLGGVTQSPQGRFGGALSLVRDAGAQGEGAAHYILKGDAGDAGPVWPEDLGSVSIWYRAVPGGAPNPVLYRPVATLPPDALATAGLAFFVTVNGRTGLYQNGADNIFTFPVSAMTPYLRSGEYNQYFAAWRKPDGGDVPTAYIAINGGLGVDYADSGASYPDAADDAGELDVPYRGFTRQPWKSQGSPVALRLGGPGGNAAEGTLDDLAVWNRVLSFEEVAAVYLAGQALGDICMLR